MSIHEIETVGKHYDRRATGSDLHDANMEMIGDILLSRLRASEWEQQTGKREGKFRKNAYLSLSRSILAQDPESTGASSGLWPTGRNTRFFADRLTRVRVDSPRLEIPNDGAFVSGAGTREQGDDKPEQTDINLEVQEVNLRSVSSWKDFTDESLEDFGSGLRGMFSKSLLQAVLMKIDEQIIAGDGIAPNVLGIRNWSGISSQSKSSDTVLVATSRAAEQIFTAGYRPDLILMHPADWQSVVTTAAVDPFAVGSKLLGIDVFVTEASPSGFPTVIDSTAVYFLDRSPLTLMASKTNDDNFLMNRTTLRAEQRVAVAITDVAAVCKIVA